MADNITRVEWAKKLCDWMHFPKDEENMWALVAWIAAESGPGPAGAKFNPLNTTLRLPGSTTFNSVGVQNYENLEQGLEATSRTLRQKAHPSYDPIRHSLLKAKPAHITLEFIEASDWGTGGGALKILDDVKKYWKRDYAFKLIPQ